jgi:hypothetical protein
MVCLTTLLLGLKLLLVGVWDERNCGLLLSLFHSEVKEVFWML